MHNNLLCARFLTAVLLGVFQKNWVIYHYSGISPRSILASLILRNRRGFLSLNSNQIGGKYEN